MYTYTKLSHSTFRHYYDKDVKTMKEHTTADILYLSRRDVIAACVDIDTIAIMRDVFRWHAEQLTYLPDEAYLSWINQKGEAVRSLNMPGFIGGAIDIAGTKIINGNINNPRRGLPRASGLTLLYDTTSAQIVCTMEAAYLSSLRTASVTLLAIELFQSSPISCAAIIGAGVLAKIHIELLAKRSPQLRQVRIYDTDANRVAELYQLLAPLLNTHDIQWYVASSAEEAIKPAQLIVPVTTTTTGYIQYQWLQPGSLLVNVSLDDPLPEIVLRAHKVIVDDWKLVKNDERRLLGRMFRSGQIIGPDETREGIQGDARRIDAQLGEIVTAKKQGRSSPDDIILVNPFGLAIEDVALASYIYQRALEKSLGIWLPR
jgi:N-[(2S)-2-amino-2-carboxyethyl]-L-glutamate dehydrogenase